MRQGQQNRRGRGRGRKPQNQLSRNLESNGPDVKIRGTASHIAEKYATLARDAAVAGDNVAGESYLQHAEHYNRIIMANQAQQQASSAQGEGMNGSGRDRQNDSPEAAGSAQPEAAPQAAASGNSADDKVAADADAAKTDAAKTDAASDSSAEGAGDDEGLARMMARSAKGSGNGADKEKQADADTSKKESASDDAGAEETPDEVVT